MKSGTRTYSREKTVCSIDGNGKPAQRHQKTETETFSYIKQRSKLKMD